MIWDVIDCFYFVDWVGIGCLRFDDDTSYVYRYQRLNFPIFVYDVCCRVHNMRFLLSTRSITFNELY